MLEVTDSAIAELKKYSEKTGEKAFDVVFSGFGWGGPSLGLVKSERKGSNDDGKSIGGLLFFVDERLKELTESYGGIIVDFDNNNWSGGRLVVGFQSGAFSC